VGSISFAEDIFMKDLRDGMNVSVNRRSFVKSGLTAATVGAGLLYPSASVLAHGGSEERSGRLDKGDASILRFLAAAEILETDLWQQYNELGGIPDSEVPGGSGNPTYTAALAVLDADMAQYIHDNTEDELTHEVFINAYLDSKGRIPSTWTNFALCPAAKRQERNR
jgi:hypothetical protein